MMIWHENNDSEEMEVDHKSGFLDIKKLTDKLSPTKILNIINQELDISKIYEINPFKLENTMDKQVLNQCSDFQNIEEIKQTFFRRKPR